MKCLDSERLISYAYRLIEEPAASEVCKHLEECVRCREIVEQHGRLDAVLSEWGSAEPSPEFDVRVREAVAALETQREGWGFWGWQWARGLALAALGVMIVAGVAWYGHNHRGDSRSSQVATRQPQNSTGAPISGQTPIQQTQADAAEAQVTPAQQVPDLGLAGATSSGDKDALAMEDYDLAANFDLLSEIPKGSDGLPTKRSAHARFTRRGSQRYRDLAGILLLTIFLLPGVMRAQEGGQREANPSRRVEPEQRQGSDLQQRRPLAGGVFRRLRELPPAEQRRVMANNPAFRSFSLERQELIRERLRQWNAMTPQEKERVRQREEIFESLSPLQRREARNIFPQWRDLPPARRQALMVAFRHLRDIPPDQRRAFLDSQNVREQFSPHERDILEGLNKLLPESRAAAPDDPDQ